MLPIHHHPSTYLSLWFAIIFGWLCLEVMMSSLRSIMINNAKKLNKLGDHQGAVVKLERLLATPLLFGNKNDYEARKLLLIWYIRDQRYEEGLEQADRVLKNAWLSKILAGEALTLRAQCLAGLGQTGEAGYVNASAEQLISHVDPNKGWLALSMQSITMSQQGRYRQAYDVLEIALPKIPKWMNRERTGSMARLMTYAHQGGMMDKTAYWAQTVLTQPKVKDILRINTLKMLGIANRALNNVSEAIRAYEEACELAQRTGKTAEYGKTMSLLAVVYRGQGDLDRAMEISNQILAIPGSMREGYLSLGETLYIAGKYTEGITAIEQASKANLLPQTAGEARLQAIFKLAIARGYLLNSQPHEARYLIKGASVQFLTDQKLGLWCKAWDCWADGLAGDVSQAQMCTKLDELTSKLADFPDDRETRSNIYGMAVRASYPAGLYERCVEYGKRYMDLKPDLSARIGIAAPIGYAYLAMGDRTNAELWFREAASGPEKLIAVQIAKAELAKQGW